MSAEVATGVAATPVTIPFSQVAVAAGGDFLPGSSGFVSPAAPGVHTSFLLSVDVSSWRPTEMVAITAQVSIDGGAWQDYGGITTFGGVHFAKGSTTVVEHPGINVQLPVYAASLKMRAVVTAKNAGAASGSVVLS